MPSRPLNLPILSKPGRSYEAQIKAAVDPITAVYLKKLDGMMKAYGAKGDLEAAQVVRNEIKRIVATKSTPKKTIVGRWAWAPGQIVEIREDGTGKATDGSTCRWTCTDSKARKFRLTWSGNATDTGQLSTDGSTISLKGSGSRAWTARRLREP